MSSLSLLKQALPFSDQVVSYAVTLVSCLDIVLPSLQSLCNRKQQGYLKMHWHRSMYFTLRIDPKASIRKLVINKILFLPFKNLISTITMSSHFSSIRSAWKSVISGQCISVITTQKYTQFLQDLLDWEVKSKFLPHQIQRQKSLRFYYTNTPITKQAAKINRHTKKQSIFS